MDITIKEHLRFEPDTGNLYWTLPKRGRDMNKPAGTVNRTTGNRYIKYSGKMELAHRVAWLLHYGYEPTAWIDHINGNPQDNRICNLREATAAQNSYNRRKNTNSTSGYKGVNLHRPTGKWHARISYNGKRVSLGYFDCAEAASRAYGKAAREMHGEFAQWTR